MGSEFPHRQAACSGGFPSTGVEHPMYASADERAAGIERGAGMSAAALVSWLRRSGEALDEAMSGSTTSSVDRQVRTAQGRWVAATGIPWLRAREVLVHCVDLRCGIAFADLPGDFLEVLVADIVAKRGGVPLPAGRCRRRLPGSPVAATLFTESRTSVPGSEPRAHHRRDTSAAAFGVRATNHLGQAVAVADLRLRTGGGCRRCSRRRRRRRRPSAPGRPPAPGRRRCPGPRDRRSG